jgi:hypothetical protein
MQEFFESTFTNIEEGAFIFMWPPPQGWANLDDCGDFPCTAPINTVASFEGSVFEGKKPRLAKEDFHLIPNNTGFSPYLKGCDGYEWMNAYVCDVEKLAILLFESQDEDNQDRSMQPIYI